MKKNTPKHIQEERDHVHHAIQLKKYLAVVSLVLLFFLDEYMSFALSIAAWAVICTGIIIFAFYDFEKLRKLSKAYDKKAANSQGSLLAMMMFLIIFLSIVIIQSYTHVYSKKEVMIDTCTKKVGSYEICKGMVEESFNYLYTN